MRTEGRGGGGTWTSEGCRARVKRLFCRHDPKVLCTGDSGPIGWDRMPWRQFTGGSLPLATPGSPRAAGPYAEGGNGVCACGIFLLTPDGIEAANTTVQGHTDQRVFHRAWCTPYCIAELKPQVGIMLSWALSHLLATLLDFPKSNCSSSHRHSGHLVLSGQMVPSLRYLALGTTNKFLFISFHTGTKAIPPGDLLTLYVGAACEEHFCKCQYS